MIFAVECAPQQGVMHLTVTIPQEGAVVLSSCKITGEMKPELWILPDGTRICTDGQNRSEKNANCKDLTKFVQEQTVNDNENHYSEDSAIKQCQQRSTPTKFDRCYKQSVVSPTHIQKSVEQLFRRDTLRNKPIFVVWIKSDGILLSSKGQLRPSVRAKDDRISFIILRNQTDVPMFGQKRRNIASL
ncbi:unnamed protein product [Gongylonema pulchrum]|uniref:Uncharacterized protein n=1 Tax=Gongylonema pulchrum TaxID=637853 RepID=A0A183CXI7_9BILA|nr:unnamed protein product [Gongylonema pulchrum]